jgi:hypothetical protein
MMENVCKKCKTELSTTDTTIFGKQYKHCRQCREYFHNPKYKYVYYKEKYRQQHQQQQKILNINHININIIDYVNLD